MRYIALTEDGDLVPAPQSVQSVDPRILKLTEECIKVLVALEGLVVEAGSKVDNGVISRMLPASTYHKGRAEAFAQAVQMLRGILNGTYSDENLTAQDIREMSAAATVESRAYDDEW